MNLYVLLTHGKKPDGSAIGNHPAARQQIANLRAFHDKYGGAIGHLRFDYCRNLVGLGSLPNLQTLLRDAKAGITGSVLMDDIGRLFQAAAPDNRERLWRELRDYAEHLKSLRQGKALSELSNLQMATMLFGARSERFVLAKPPTKPKSATARKEQTAEAKEASIVARRGNADALARQLASIQAELTSDGVAPSFVKVADEANRRGLRTERDNAWNSSTVGRMLRRLEGPSLTDRAKALRAIKDKPPRPPQAG